MFCFVLFFLFYFFFNLFYFYYSFVSLVGERFFPKLQFRYWISGSSWFFFVFVSTASDFFFLLFLFLFFCFFFVCMFFFCFCFFFSSKNSHGPSGYQIVRPEKVYTRKYTHTMLWLIFFSFIWLTKTFSGKCSIRVFWNSLQFKEKLMQMIYHKQFIYILYTLTNYHYPDLQCWYGSWVRV